MSAGVPAVEVQAALDRAIGSLLMQAAFNDTDRFEQVRHVARELRLVLDRRWANSPAYQAPPMLQAAWPALPVGIEWMAMSQVQQFLAAQGVDLAFDEVTHQQLDAGQQLELAELALTGPHQKETDARGHGRHDTTDVVSLHGVAL